MISLRIPLRPWIGIATLALTSAGCELTVAEKNTLHEALTEDPGSTYVLPPTPPAPACFQQRFVQPEAIVTRKVDILFVTDTSGSLNTERGRIADGIDAFVAELPAGVNYRIGVLPSHSSKSPHSGKLARKGTNAYVLDSATQTLTVIRSQLRQNLVDGVNGYIDYAGDGGEEGMYSMQKMLSPTGLSAARAKGFLREDAALAVVFVSDENDICAEYPAGVTPVYDGDHYEASAKARDCAGITPASTLAKLREVKGNMPLFVGGIQYTDPTTVPAGAENEYGYGTMELIALANGAAIDIGSRDYRPGLSHVGSLVTVALNLITEFGLSNSALNPASIGVDVDGARVPFRYVEAAREVHLDREDAGQARSVVDIGYCLLPTPTPSSSPTPSPTPTVTPTSTPTPSPTPTPTSSPSPRPSPSPTIIPPPVGT